VAKPQHFAETGG